MKIHVSQTCNGLVYLVVSLLKSRFWFYPLKTTHHLVAPPVGAPSAVIVGSTTVAVATPVASSISTSHSIHRWSVSLWHSTAATTASVALLHLTASTTLLLTIITSSKSSLSVKLKIWNSCMSMSAFNNTPTMHQFEIPRYTQVNDITCIL